MSLYRPLLFLSPPFLSCEARFLPSAACCYLLFGCSVYTSCGSISMLTCCLTFPLLSPPSPCLVVSCCRVRGGRTGASTSWSLWGHRGCCGGISRRAKAVRCCVCISRWREDLYTRCKTAQARVGHVLYVCRIICVVLDLWNRGG